MITNRKLHHAVVLAEQGSFRSAAEVLHLTQPALTRSIQSLESALGVSLFDRGPGGVEPTTFGEVVIDRARAILTGVSELEREIDLLQGLGAGTLEVSLGPYPAALSGKLAFARFYANHPEIQCRVRVAGYAEVADDVIQGRCELGLADLEIAAERGLMTELVVDRQAYFFARSQHPLAARRRCTMADALQFPWASIRFPKRAGRHLPDDVGRAGHWDLTSGEFVPALEADVVSDFLTLAHDSDILVGGTFTMAEEYLAAGKLTVLPIVKPWLRLHYGFVSRRGRTQSPAALEFMRIVREIEDDLEEREAALRERFL
jgi:DNA-binding transcriptional LysR family regulator